MRPGRAGRPAARWYGRSRPGPSVPPRDVSRETRTTRQRSHSGRPGGAGEDAGGPV
ncbi:hypothetical protein SFR_3075 [Streptomyces sp. FR-008]|nr:hypothetical protein SFR_3075 [Streptomyces sp. FR-008]